MAEAKTKALQAKLDALVTSAKISLGEELAAEPHGSSPPAAEDTIAFDRRLSASEREARIEQLKSQEAGGMPTAQRHTPSQNREAQAEDPAAPSEHGQESSGPMRDFMDIEPDQAEAAKAAEHAESVTALCKSDDGLIVHQASGILGPTGKKSHRKSHKISMDRPSNQRPTSVASAVVDTNAVEHISNFLEGWDERTLHHHDPDLEQLLVELRCDAHSDVLSKERINALVDMAHLSHSDLVELGFNVQEAQRVIGAPWSSRHDWPPSIALPPDGH